MRWPNCRRRKETKPAHHRRIAVGDRKDTPRVRRAGRGGSQYRGASCGGRDTKEEDSDPRRHAYFGRKDLRRKSRPASEHLQRLAIEGDDFGRVVGEEDVVVHPGGSTLVLD